MTTTKPKQLTSEKRRHHKGIHFFFGFSYYEVFWFFSSSCKTVQRCLWTSAFCPCFCTDLPSIVQEPGRHFQQCLTWCWGKVGYWEPHPEMLAGYLNPTPLVLRGPWGFEDQILDIQHITPVLYPCELSLRPLTLFWCPTQENWETQSCVYISASVSFHWLLCCLSENRELCQADAFREHTGSLPLVEMEGPCMQAGRRHHWIAILSLRYFLKQ